MTHRSSCHCGIGTHQSQTRLPNVSSLLPRLPSSVVLHLSPHSPFSAPPIDSGVLHEDWQVVYVLIHLVDPKRSSRGAHPSSRRLTDGLIGIPRFKPNHEKYKNNKQERESTNDDDKTRAGERQSRIRRLFHIERASKTGGETTAICLWAAR